MLHSNIKKKKPSTFCLFKDSLVAQRKVCLQRGRPEFDSWVGKTPWRRKWQSTPVFLPGKSRGRRSLPGHGILSCLENPMDRGEVWRTIIQRVAKSQTRLSNFTFIPRW